MADTHSARLAPFQPETVWTLKDGTLVETRGLRVRGFPAERPDPIPPGRRAQGRSPPGAAAELRPRQAHDHRAELCRARHAEDRLESFSAFARALSRQAADAAPTARFSLARIEARPALTWVAGFLAIGVVALLLSSLSAGMAAIGLDMAARMAFVLILLLGALPWLSRGDAFDPRDPPRDLLP
jgi:hypothetical protein